MELVGEEEEPVQQVMSLAWTNIKVVKPSIKQNLKSTLENALLISKKVPPIPALEATGNFWIEKRFISANNLQAKRFSGDEVYIQRSDATVKLMSDECQKDIDNNNVTLITGPAGLGKSYALLFYVLNLRRDNTCSILYINDPVTLLGDPVPYLRNEIIYAIAGDLKSDLKVIGSEVFKLQKDEIKEDDILDCFSKAEQWTQLLEIIVAFHRYYLSKQKVFMLVLDQYTNIQEECRRQTQPLYLEALIFRFSKKIFGKSNLQPTSMTSPQKEIFLGGKFSKEEANCYFSQKLNKVDSTFKKELFASKEAWSRIEMATECIPYEMEVIVRLTSKYQTLTTDGIIEDFYSQRFQDIRELHIKWIQQLSKPEVENIDRFIFLLDNSLAQGKESLQNLIPTPNPNLIYYDNEKKQWCYISNLVKLAIYKYQKEQKGYIEFLSGNLKNFMKEIIEMMQNEETNGRTKGNLFEKFIEETVRIAFYHKEEYKLEYYDKTTEKTMTITLPFNNPDIQFTLKSFNNSDLENEISQCLTKKSVGFLIPNDPNFAYVDFVVVDPRNEEEQLVYLLQTTINIKNHLATDIFFATQVEKLLTSPSAKVHVISSVWNKITNKFRHCHKKYIWISGDDIWRNVNPINLISKKHSDCGIALTKVNKPIAKFLSY